MKNINDLPYEVLHMILENFNTNQPNTGNPSRGFLSPLFDAMRVCMRWLRIVCCIIYETQSFCAEVFIVNFQSSLGRVEATASKYWNDPHRPVIVMLSREQVLIRKLEKQIAELQEELRIVKYVKATNKEEW